METLGVWLRQAREAKGDLLEDVEAVTRIRPRFLQALEAGDFAALPGGDVQARGFLRIYARYLGLSPDEALARYEAEVRGVAPVLPPAMAAPRIAPAPRPLPGPAALPPANASASLSQARMMNIASLVLAGLAIFVILAAVAVAFYFGGKNGSVGAASGPTPTATWASPVVSTGSMNPAAVTPTFPVNPQGGVTLTLEGAEHVWVRVTADGVTLFEGMLAPQQAVSWTAQQLISVETGNGAGVWVTVNGQPHGAMCGRAEVCTRSWGPTGEVLQPF